MYGGDAAAAAAGGGGDMASRKRPASAITPGGPLPPPPRPAVKKRPMLDTSRVGHKIWLVKVPVAVADAVRAAQDGTKLGMLTVTKTSGPSGEHRTESVRLESELCDPVGLPRDFTLEAPPADAKMPKMYAIRYPDESSSAAAGPGGVKPMKATMSDRLRVEGVVARRTSLLPTASIDYRAFAKRRIVQAHKKDRRLEVLKDLPSKPKGDRSREISFADDVNDDMVVGGPRGKLDANELRTELFRLFEQKPSWSLKELRDRLPSQTEASIKAALKNLADYQQQGTYRGQYVLKSTFVRKQPAVDAKPAATG